MTIPEPWIQPAIELKAFAEAIGLDPTQFTEWPDDLVYDKADFQTDKLNLPDESTARTERLNALTQVLNNLIEKYGDALELRLNLGPEELTTDQTKTVTAAVLEAFCEKITGSPFDVHLKINKQQLASQWGFTDSSTSFKIFLFPEALRRALGVSLTQLEEEKGLMWRITGEHKLMILLPDDEGIALNGEYLTILGGEDNVRRWKDYRQTGRPEDALAKVRAIHNQRIERPRWTGIGIQSLTPLHLYVNWPGENDVSSRQDSIVNELFGQLLVCSLLYLASTSRTGTTAMAGTAGERDYPWTFTFSEEKYSAKIELQDTSALKRAMTTDDGLSAAYRLGSLAKWVFEDERALIHRLAVIQIVIASALQENEASANLNELIRKSDELTKRVWQRWDDFMVDKLGKYFLQLKQVEDTVTSTTQNHAEQIQSLAKTLIDNMLAAVGVVVGSFIAAILKSPFEDYIFWIGIGVYLGYLIVFPVGVGLASAWQRFTDSREAFQKSEKEFGGRLSPEEVAQLVGTTVTESENKFTRWFVFTSAAYAVVVLVLSISMWALPAEIRRWTDNFELDSLDYTRSQPASSDLVPLIIRGANFDKD